MIPFQKHFSFNIFHTGKQLKYFKIPMSCKDKLSTSWGMNIPEPCSLFFFLLLPANEYADSALCSMLTGN